MPRVGAVNEPPIFNKPPEVIFNDPVLGPSPKITLPLTISCDPTLNVSVPFPLGFTALSPI